MIWDEVGKDQFEREKVLHDLEQECLEVYRRKVDSANISRARLHQELAESEAEFTHLLLSLGERSLPGRVLFHPIQLFEHLKLHVYELKVQYKIEHQRIVRIQIENFKPFSN
jgi:hypothetical protein